MWICSKCGAEKEHGDLSLVAIKDTDLPNISSTMFAKQLLCEKCKTHSLKASCVKMEEVTSSDTHVEGYVTAEWECSICGHVFTSEHSTENFDAHFDKILDEALCENMLCKSPYGSVAFRRLIGASIMETGGVFI